MSISDAVGYIVYYNGASALIQNSTTAILNGLNKGTTYTVDVYSYDSLFSDTSKSSITVRFDG